MTEQFTFLAKLSEFTWSFSTENIDWDDLEKLYQEAPLGNKKAQDVALAFNNSMFKCFVYDGEKMIGVGRALADGADCSYICDVAIRPAYQGFGLGKKIVMHLVEKSSNHKKIILYAAPGKENFYKKLGFSRMNTAMAIFKNHSFAMENGYISDDSDESPNE